MVCCILLQLDLILKSTVVEEFLGTALLRVTLDTRFQREVLFRNFEGMRKWHSSAQVELARPEVVTC